jgi:hypothetical protein
LRGNEPMHAALRHVEQEDQPAVRP